MAIAPCVSVLIPSYNHAAFLTEAVGSVMAQTFTDWEVVIVDDCSTDATTDLLATLTHPRVKVLKNTFNRGINATLATALAASSGRYVAVLASDDILLPHKLEEQVGRLESSAADVVYSGGCVLLPDGRRQAVDLSPFAADFSRGRALDRAYTDDTSLPLMQSALFSRAAFTALSAYREQVKLDDWITLIKALELYRVEFMPEPSFLYRQHLGNTYRRYETTLGMRLEVIAAAVPPAFRRIAMSKLFVSQAKYLAWDGRIGEALRFFLAAQALQPRLSDAGSIARAVLWRVRHKAGRTS